MQITDGPLVEVTLLLSVLTHIIFYDKTNFVPPEKDQSSSRLSSQDLQNRMG
jgi:hypothetical protein